MSALRIIRRFLQLQDVDPTDLADGTVPTYRSSSGKLEMEVPPSASGAPGDANYLVGTAQGGLSAEIVVGTAPGGELGGTWGSPTIDTVHSGSSHAQAQAAAEATAAAALASAVATITSALSGKQPLDDDLTAIALLTTTSYGRTLLTLANLAALYTLLGVDTDTTMAADSDTKLASQKAIKAYVDANAGGGGGASGLGDVLAVSGDPDGNPVTGMLEVVGGLFARLDPDGDGTGPVVHYQNKGDSTRPGTVLRYTRGTTDFDLISDGDASVVLGDPTLAEVRALKGKYGTSVETALFTISGTPGNKLRQGGDGENSNWVLEGNYGVWSVLRLLANGSQSASILELCAHDGSPLTVFTAAGLPQWAAAANEQTTVGSAGGASSPPATPTKYLKVVDSDGTTLVIPAYDAS